MSQVPTKIVLKSTTRMSLNDRFSNIKAPTVQTIRSNMAAEHQASAANRRLAQQLSNRPGFQQHQVNNMMYGGPVNVGRGQARGGRRGQGQQGINNRGNVKSRLTLPNNNRGRGRGGNFNNNNNNNFRPSSGGFNNPSPGGFNNPSSGGFNNRGRGGVANRNPRGRGAFRGQQFNNRGNGQFSGRGRGRGGNAVNTQQRGGNRGRGGRGRGLSRGGRGGRGGNTTNNKSATDLDQELDQYMSKTKSSLDMELDAYMAATD